MIGIEYANILSEKVKQNDQHDSSRNVYIFGNMILLFEWSHTCANTVPSTFDYFWNLIFTAVV